jgi:hypothetical protein
VHEWQVKELTFRNRKFAIDPSADRPVRDGTGLRVGRISASLAAEQIARELVQQNEKSERAIHAVLPVIEHPTGSGLVGWHKSGADLAVEAVVGLEPFVGAGRSPEGKYSVWCRDHVFGRSRCRGNSATHCARWTLNQVNSSSIRKSISTFGRRHHAAQPEAEPPGESRNATWTAEAADLWTVEAGIGF